MFKPLATRARSLSLVLSALTCSRQERNVNSFGLVTWMPIYFSVRHEPLQSALCLLEHKNIYCSDGTAETQWQRPKLCLSAQQCLFKMSFIKLTTVYLGVLIWKKNCETSNYLYVVIQFGSRRFVYCTVVLSRTSYLYYEIRVIGRCDRNSESLLESITCFHL